MAWCVFLTLALVASVIAQNDVPTNDDTMQSLPDILRGVVSSPLKCPEGGWQGLGQGGKCFKLFSSLTPRDVAQERCREVEGGQLATVTDEKTRNFITLLPVQNALQECVSGVWVGLSDKVNEAGSDPLSPKWLWSDGTPLGSYRPWAAQQPQPDMTGSDHTMDNDCVYLSGSGLHTNPCMASWCYVCERPEESMDINSLVRRLFPGIDGSSASLK